MTIKINKWGNGLGLRINKKLATELGLKAGSEVDILQEDGRLVIIPNQKEKMTIEWLCADMTPENTYDEWHDIVPVGKERFWEDE